MAAQSLQFDVVIVGAGPAGMMAAIAAARGGARVAVVDRLHQPGTKLLATGGGRCNLTNTLKRGGIMAHFGRHGEFMLPALEMMDTQGICQFFARLGVRTHAADGFHVFPVSERAADVQQAMQRECEKLNVQFIFRTCATGVVVREGFATGIRAQWVQIDGRGLSVEPVMVSAARVILAAGGQSYPELGSDGSGFRLAGDVGHRIIQPVPALVPLIALESWAGSCAGIVVSPARVWIEFAAGVKCRRPISATTPATACWGELLFTHKGISGPAALDISGDVAASGRARVPVKIDLTPDTPAEAWAARIDDWQRSAGKKAIRNLLDAHLPGRLAATVCRLAGIEPSAHPAEVTRPQRQALAELITRLPLTITRTEGFSKAIVTRGGVDLREVDPDTLESQFVDGLHFAGEILDLDGPTGGYNLTWAFASGWLAGSACAG